MVKSKTEIKELIHFICNFYETYKKCLNLNHNQAVERTQQTYDDLYEWVYEDEFDELKEKGDL